MKAVIPLLAGFLIVIGGDIALGQGLAPTDPSQIQRQLQDELPVPPTQPQDLRFEPIPKRPVNDLKDVSFSFRQVEIKGSTVLTNEVKALETDFNQRFSGQVIQLSEILKLRAEIERLYNNRNYALVRVILPEQDISNGDVRLEIIEGFVEGYRFERGTRGQIERIRGYLDNITSQKVAKVDNIERNLLLINDLAGYEVTARLEPGTRRGGVLLVLSVGQKRVGGFYEVNNWATQAVGPVRLQSGIFLNSLGDQGEQITLSGATTLFDFEELRNFSVNFVVPVGADGLSLFASASYTETQPGAEVKPLKLLGKSFNLNTVLRYALIRSIRTNVNIQTGFQLNNNTVIARLVEPPIYLYMDRTRDIQVGIDFNHQYKLGFVSGVLVLSQGIPNLGARNRGTSTIPLSTEFGRTNAFRANFGLNHILQLPAGLSIQVNTAGQVSSSPLLIANQFGLGGASFGSAYVPSQIIGDSGYGVRVEAQKIFRYKVGNLASVTQGYLFFDYGQVFNQRPSASVPAAQDIASAGFGLRQWFANWLQFRTELGFPLVSFANIEAGSLQFRFSLQSIF